MSIDLVDPELHTLEPDHPETLTGRERLSAEAITDIMLCLVEFSAIDRLIAEHGHNKRHYSGIRNYLNHVEPVFAAAREGGMAAVEAYVTKNWQDRLAVDAQRRHDPLARRITDMEERNIVDRRRTLMQADIAHDGELTPHARIAIWLRFVASDEEAADFCDEQGLHDYLADTPSLANFLADGYLYNSLVTGQNIVDHLGDTRDLMRGYIDFYYTERQAT